MENSKNDDYFVPKIALLLNIMIVVFAVVGTILMLFFRGEDQTLQANGISNLKYFTVLSNEACGIVAVVCLLRRLRGKRQPMLAKLTVAAAVGLTFLTIAAFLGPMYGMLKMYHGANFFFHLVLPLTAMAEFVLSSDEEEIPFGWTFFTMVPVLAYGAAYLTNILINGVGVWPDTNDFYGFVNWGLPVGIGIFAGILLATWGIACALRAAHIKVNRPRIETNAN
jgi:hypothetical protein